MGLPCFGQQNVLLPQAAATNNKWIAFQTKPQRSYTALCFLVALFCYHSSKNKYKKVFFLQGVPSHSIEQNGNVGQTKESTYDKLSSNKSHRQVIFNQETPSKESFQFVDQRM